MACERYKPLISAMLDGELTAEETAALQTHLDECPACRAYLDDQRLLQEGLCDLEEEPPARVADGVMTALYSKKKRRFFVGPGTLIGAAAAIVVLLVAYGKLPFLNGQSEKTEPAQAAYDAAKTPEPSDAAFFAAQSDEGSEEALPEEDSVENDQEPIEEREMPEMPAEEPAEPETLAPDAPAAPGGYVEVYNYSDSLPIEELDGRAYILDGDNMVYTMTVAEARAIVEKYETTLTLYADFTEDCADDAPAQLVVMP